MRWGIRHNCWVNGVRLVLLALSTTACANALITDNANNASLTPPQKGPWCDQDQKKCQPMLCPAQPLHPLTLWYFTTNK